MIEGGWRWLVLLLFCNIADWRYYIQGREKHETELRSMGIMRGIVAGVGAAKLGGGCVSTILIFILLYWLLGQAGC